MSTRRAPAQRLTNTFVVSSGASAYLYNLTTLTASLNAQSGMVQVGSLFVAPSVAAVTTAFSSAITTAALAAKPAASATVTDIGKTITIEVNNATDGAVALKLREIKYQTATSTFVTGYVVEENNYNAALVGADTSGTSAAIGQNALKVAVARV